MYKLSKHIGVFKTNINCTSKKSETTNYKIKIFISCNFVPYQRSKKCVRVQSEKKIKHASSQNFTSLTLFLKKLLENKLYWNKERNQERTQASRKEGAQHRKEVNSQVMVKGNSSITVKQNPKTTAMLQVPIKAGGWRILERTSPREK